MAGFWVLTAKACVPASPRCSGSGPTVGSFSTEVGIDVRGDMVTISAPATHKQGGNPLVPVPAHTDTLRVDGNILAWIPGHRGFARKLLAPVASDRYPVYERGTRIPWPGESWEISRDGTTLVHEYRWKQRGDSAYRITWIYHRAAG